MEVLTRTWIAHGPVSLVLAATEPARAPELHPLITAVSDIGPDGAGERWVIDEQVPFGPLRIPNRYRARRELVAPDRLVLEAWSKPSVHLLHTLELRPQADTVEVTHTVAIDAPWAVRAFVVATARTAHDEWIARVRTWIAAEAVRISCGGTRQEVCNEPYRAGTRLVHGVRKGTPWQVLVTAEGPAFVRVPAGGRPCRCRPRLGLRAGRSRQHRLRTDPCVARLVWPRSGRRAPGGNPTDLARGSRAPLRRGRRAHRPHPGARCDVGRAPLSPGQLPSAGPSSRYTS